MRAKRFNSLALSVVGLALISCVGVQAADKPGTYKRHSVGQAQSLARGVILSRDAVKIDQNKGIGAAAGAGLGAIGGAVLGGNTAGSLAAGIAGGLLGGLAGDAVEKGVSKRSAYRYVVRLEGGNLISLVQRGEPLDVNARVFLVHGNPDRLILDTTK